MLRSSYYTALFIECQMKGKSFYHVSLWFTDVYGFYFLGHKKKSKIFVMLRFLLDENGSTFYIFYYLINLYLCNWSWQYCLNRSTLNNGLEYFHVIHWIVWNDICYSCTKYSKIIYVKNDIGYLNFAKTSGKKWNKFVSFLKTWGW